MLTNGYEDMFNEIASKWYGEPPRSEPQQNQQNIKSPIDDLGLVYLNNQQKSATPDPLLPLLVVEKVSHTTSTSNLTTTPRQHVMKAKTFESKKPLVKTSTWFESEELFPWNTPTRVASYNATLRKFRCQDEDCGYVGLLNQIAEHWVGMHSNMRVFQCPCCAFNSTWANCIQKHLKSQHSELKLHDNGRRIRKENPALDSVTKYLLRLKNCVLFQIRSAGRSEEGVTGKLYKCPQRPYSLERESLLTRHAHHSDEEKAYKCGICDKQFTTLDHYKSHHSRKHKDVTFALLKMEKTALERISSAPENINRGTTTTVSKQQITTVPAPTTTIETSSQVPTNGTLEVQQQQQQSRPVIVTAAYLSSSSGDVKKKKKIYACTYCNWQGKNTGVLNRHLNTHNIPFACPLCEHRAARKDNLATHVLNVHKKWLCTMCFFVVDDKDALSLHKQERH